jgi:hypothetical protein
VIIVAINYIVFSFGWMHAPIVIQPFTVPFGVSGFIATGGDFRGSLRQLCELAVSALIYYPFFKAWERILVVVLNRHLRRRSENRYVLRLTSRSTYKILTRHYLLPHYQLPITSPPERLPGEGAPGRVVAAENSEKYALELASTARPVRRHERRKQIAEERSCISIFVGNGSIVLKKHVLPGCTLLALHEQRMKGHVYDASISSTA